MAHTLILSSVSAHAANLITNGSFTSNASGWTLAGAGCAPATYDGSVGNPAGSVYINACGEANSDPFVAQTVSGLAPGGVYNLTWDVRSEGGAGFGTGKSFGVFFNSEPSTPIFLGEWAVGSGWHTETISFVATSSVETIIFADELDARTPGGPGITTDVATHIDNVSLVAQVPEPGMAALLGGGLIALFVLNRVRTGRKYRVRAFLVRGSLSAATSFPD